jgi:hypothetical protein
MDSFKKISIATISAVALLATTILAVPANASITAAVTVGEENVATTAKVIATPATPTVPADNKVDLADTVKFVVTVANNTTVSAAATDAKLVSALHATGAPVTSADGSATISGNSGSGTTVTFYAFTNKATTGSVVVSTGGSSTTYYLKGVAGDAYNLSVVAPKVSTLSAASPLTATVTDVFGNAVTNASISNTVIRGTVGSFVYSDADKVYKATFTASGVAGDAIVESKISATAIAGLPKPVDSVVYTISVGDLAAQVEALTKRVSELEASLAKSVTKKKYNKLVRKWNRSNPNNRVSLSR